MNFSLRCLLIMQLAALLLCVMPSSGVCGSQADSLTAPINDGPYLYRNSDSSIIAIYLCNDTLLVDTTYSDGNEFHVAGTCHDSGSEYVVPVDGFRIKAYEYSGVSQVISISDVHGEYEYMVEILQNSGVVDSSLNWIWGDGHLVVDGDIFDRGDMTTECLWLLYRLEQEAALHGGCVHVLLGNHEEMVMTGDNRYVHDKYLNGIVKHSRIDLKDLYGPYTILGQWLRTRHTIIIINDVLYVHAGLAPSFVDSGLTAAKINDAVRRYIDFNSLQYRLDRDARQLLGSTGPLWYRGLWQAKEGYYEKATDADIDRIFGFYDVTSMVVGHTNMDSIMTHYDGRVFAIDVLYEDLGSLQALLWQDGIFYRVTGSGELVRLK